MFNIARGHTNHTHAASTQYAFLLLHVHCHTNRAVGQLVSATSTFSHCKVGTVVWTNPLKILLQSIVYVYTCTGICIVNQSFYRQIAGYQRGVGDHRVGQ